MLPTETLKLQTLQDITCLIVTGMKPRMSNCFTNVYKPIFFCEHLVLVRVMIAVVSVSLLVTGIAVLFWAGNSVVLIN